MKKRKVFESAVVGGIEVKNRIIRSATSDPIGAENSEPSQSIFNKYEKLSKGDVELIVMGYLVFSKTDHYSEGDLALNNETLSGFRKVTDMVHNNDTRIVAQLNHAGTQLFFQPEEAVYGPSEYTDPVSGNQATAFSVEQIQDLIKEFGEAASYAKSAGFDGVQIHAAHGYLLNKFLSPVFNKRTDKYGGNPQKNRRIVIDILNEIKTRCGKDYPVWIKLNSSDFDPEDKGFREEDFLALGEELSNRGMDAIEVSGGSMAGHFSFSRGLKHSAYHLGAAEKMAVQSNVSVILVGGIRDLEIIDSIFSETDIDAVSISRPLVREPELVKRWKEGDRSKAKCVACNGCFNRNGVQCFFTLSDEEKEAQKPIMKMMQSPN